MVRLFRVGCHTGDSPNVMWARSSAGRARESHSRGQGFESPRVHQADFEVSLAPRSTHNSNPVGKVATQKINVFTNARIGSWTSGTNRGGSLGRAGV